MRAGNFWVMRQKRAAGRWADPKVPEFEPNWVIKTRLPGLPVKTESARVGICDLCLAVDPAENPARVRPNCRCLKPAVEFAKGRLQQLAGLWHAGRLEEMQATLRPQAVVSIGTLVDTYSANVPERFRPTAKNYIASLKVILTQFSGKTWEQCRQLAVTVLTKELVVDWMRLRQQYNLERDLPEGQRRSWDALRGALALARDNPRSEMALPGLITDLPVPGNYTINSAYSEARSLVGRKARSHYLPGLNLPELTFGEVSAIAAARRGGGDHSTAAVEGLLALGEKWKREDLEKWIAFRLMITCGLRSVEVRWARRHWLKKGKWLDDAGLEWEGWALVLKNYPEDPPLNPGGKVEHLPGFWQKAKQSDKVRAFRLDSELLAILLPRHGLLVAPELSYTSRNNLIQREMSQEMRPMMSGKGTNHDLRKLSVSVVADRSGIDAAAAHGGHTRQVAETFYARSRQTLSVVTDEDLRTREG